VLHKSKVGGSELTRTLLFTNSDVRFCCLKLNVSDIFEQYANVIFVCVISVFRHEIDEICALLGYYAAYSGFLDSCSWG